MGRMNPDPPNPYNGARKKIAKRASSSIVTAKDLAQADVLLDAASAYVDDAKTGDREAARKTVAAMLADFRETTLACAMVRVQRMFKVVPRKVT